MVSRTVISRKSNELQRTFRNHSFFVLHSFQNRFATTTQDGKSALNGSQTVPEYFLVMAAHKQDLYNFLLHILPYILQYVAGIYQMYVGLMMNLGHVNILGYGSRVTSAQTTSSNCGGIKIF